MTIDYATREYIKVGNYSNILFEYNKLEADDRIGWSVHLHDKMALILHKLAMAHPDWTFVVKGGVKDVANKCWRNSHDTRVIFDDEVLGEIKLDTWKNGTPYEIDCHAISAARSRRGGAWTTKFEKAYKLVEENFRPMELGQRLQQAKGAIQSTVGSNAWQSTRRFANAMEKLHLPLAAYVAAHLEEIKSALPANSAADLDTLVSTLAEYNDAINLNNAVQNKTGVMVLVHGDKYYLSDDDFSTYDCMPSHLIPSEISGKIGVLKAFDQDSVSVETIGMRVNKNTYFII